MKQFIKRKKRLRKNMPRIELNYSDYYEHQTEICEQIFAQFGINNWIVLKVDNYDGRTMWNEDSYKIFNESISIGFHLPSENN